VPRSIRHFSIAIPLVVSAGAILSTVMTARLLHDKTLPFVVISQNEDVNFTFTMQAIMLLVSLLVLALMFVYDRPAFMKFFRIGDAVQPSAGNAEWKQLGPLVAIGFTMGTTAYMSFSVSAGHGQINATFFGLLPLVLLFAATNAWSEEIFSRFLIVAGLQGKVKPVLICWISAIFFGVPHFFGTPSGIFGVIMSGLLGWVLAKSVIETRGLGWALLIHFFQDVVIFGAGAMVIAGSS